jgi:processive 1,2-diacylglycerol beta-glucosyltransferase
MKTLILTVTTGEGHNSTAKALKKQLEENGHECEILDIYLNINKGLYDIVSKGYLLTVDKFKKLYSKVYTKLEHRNERQISIPRIVNGVIEKKTYETIINYNPDVIIYTHAFCGILLDVIKEKRGCELLSIGIVTDYVMHPFWEETLRTDYIVIPNELLIPAAKRKGFTDEQILPLGIPIDPKFSKITPKAEMRARLGLDIDKTTVLIMGGSMGYGSLSDIIKRIDALELDLQIICVCGNNAEEREKIDSETYKNKILNFGYVSNVDELMDAADCIVSKPGGLTTSETLAKRLPMIICNPIPGHEQRNAEFLQNNGTAMAIGGSYTIADAIHQLFHIQSRVENMRQNIDVIRKPDSTKDICEFAERIVKKKNEEK